jgi:cytosine deaminase
LNGIAAVELDDCLVLPRFVDVHTHLDKAQIWQRSSNPNGTFLAARTTVAADREARWTSEDVRAHMQFSLRCAFAHGTEAIRTHIDSIGTQTAISWPVFTELRDDWKDRLKLQGVALFPVDLAINDKTRFRKIVATVARHGAVLGGLTSLGEPPDEKLDRALDRVIGAAAAYGLDLDFHVVESDNSNARTLDRLAAAARTSSERQRSPPIDGAALAVIAHDVVVIGRVSNGSIAAGPRAMLHPCATRHGHGG